MRPLLFKFTEPIYSIVRLILGLLFASYGSQALFNFPPGEPHELPALIVVGKAIELAGGLMIASGLLTSIAAFICSGEMAVAYFMFHAKAGFWPTVNKGDMAVLYCFVFLFMAAKGSGWLSIDAFIQRRSGGGR